MTKGAQTRERLIQTTAKLLESQGYHGTGLNQVIAESGTPKGSLYFHFPGGKKQLAAEALATAAASWRAQLQGALTGATSAGAALNAACGLLAKRLERSNYEKGCPLATTTLEIATQEEALREVCSNHFRAWEQWIGDLIAGAGAAPEQAAAEASFALCAIEGALVLARAHQSTKPLLQAGTILQAHLDRLGTCEPQTQSEKKC